MNLIKINKEIKAIVGLGNPGPTYAFTPHNIGFLILDQLCQMYGGMWVEKQNMLMASVQMNDQEILLVKPQTFMNSSGEILNHLNKRGIKIENLFVIHDEIDYPFGKINIKDGGSARGHNGLRSIIEHGGQDFVRLRCGVGRPDSAEEVGNFVTKPFEQSQQQVHELVEQAAKIILEMLTA
jgi:peptidyl-tRNA hydrolase, PTH1 family